MNLKALGLLAATLFTSQAVFAHHHGDHDDHKQASDFKGESQTIGNDITIEHARAKETIPGVKVGAGYFTITNNSDKTIELVSAKTSVAEHTEIHRMFMRDSKMAMRKVDSIEIEANSTFELTPGGYHLMFMMLTQRLTAGEAIDLELTFSNGVSATINMPVIKAKL